MIYWRHKFTGGAGAYHYLGQGVRSIVSFISGPSVAVVLAPVSCLDAEHNVVLAVDAEQNIVLALGAEVTGCG